MMAKRFKLDPYSRDVDLADTEERMLFLAVNISTCIGACLKKKICKMRLRGYNYNIRYKLTIILSTYTTKKELGFKHNNIIMDIFEVFILTKFKFSRKLV